jgi:8-oxo-dGTP pyrophosphatase MutT (NUDIX family)
MRRVVWLAARRLVGRHYVGVTGVVVDDRGRVLAIEHRFRSPRWGLPAGWVRPNEEPAAAVEREILEEAGIVVRARSIVACEAHGDASSRRRDSGITIAFRCVVVPGEPHAPAASIEVMSVDWLDAASAATRLSAFEILAVDASRVAPEDTT